VDEERRAAFDALVEHRATTLLRTAYLLTGDWGLAEDLLQTALAKTYLRWHRLRDPEAGEAYVRRVLVSTCGKWRRRKWRGEVPTDVLPERLDADPYADADLRDALCRALASLPAPQRAVLVLRYFDDLTEEQVATALGCSLGTVKSRAARALAALRGTGLLDEEPAPLTREEFA
jgi:RNA polymerase sigma-70 factor (ECF subfamily)